MSPSSKSQLSRSASLSAMVLLPEPDTPITIKAHGAALISSLTKILRKRGPIHQPDRLAYRMRAARGQVLAIQHARQNRAFFRARNLEQHFAAAVERRQGQRYPRYKRLDIRLGNADHPAFGLLDGWVIRK